jgi:hypothetical protein
VRQQPELHRPFVKVFIGDPPSFLFSVPDWEARDRIRRHEAREIWTGTRRRGIQVIPKTKARSTQVHTLQGQLSEWQEAIQREHPDLWAPGLARLDQAEGRGSLLRGGIKGPGRTRLQSGGVDGR